MTEKAKGPLSGIPVIDLSRILAGPYCTLLMAEMGARVIKVEAPKGGDDARAYGPFIKGKSTYFASVNRGKESIALDLKSDQDRAIFDKLLAKAPQLIYASASGFGHTGPNSRDPAYDMVVQGMGGIMSITGSVGGEPVRVGMSIGDIGAGLYTAVAVNAALVHRLKTGEATKVDIGMFDCQIALLENAVMRYTVEGEVPGPLGARHPTIVPFQAFKTGDGAIIISAGNDGLFVKMCNALGLGALTADPDYKTNALRQKHHGKLESVLETLLKTQTTAHWLAIMAKADIPAGPINNIEQALAHPQVAARNMLVSVPDGSGGTLSLAGNPIKMSAFDDPKTRKAAPDLDADRAAILSYIGG